MSKKEKEKQIVNKIRLMVELQAWGELDKDKYSRYLYFSFSCNHCKHRDVFCGDKQVITQTHNNRWCFSWLKPENFVG
jgi:hypothetical protein